MCLNLQYMYNVRARKNVAWNSFNIDSHKREKNAKFILRHRPLSRIAGRDKLKQ